MFVFFSLLIQFLLSGCSKRSKKRKNLKIVCLLLYSLVSAWFYRSPLFFSSFIPAHDNHKNPSLQQFFSRLKVSNAWKRGNSVPLLEITIRNLSLCCFSTQKVMSLFVSILLKCSQIYLALAVFSRKTFQNMYSLGQNLPSQPRCNCS